MVYLGELTLSRKVVLPDGRLQLDDTPEFLRLKEEFDWRPKLAGAISGVLGQEESFGTACRIAKRWINCQLLHDYMPEEAVELIMAQVSDWHLAISCQRIFWDSIHPSINR